MLKNYLKVALRSLNKNKIYAVINILGLSVGLACCILILLHVQDELSYDKFHNNSENIYRVALERKYPSHSTHYAVIPHSFSKVIESDYPEVEAAARLFYFPGNTVFRYEDEKGNLNIFEEKKFVQADSNFFDIFSIPIIKGNKNEVLKNPNAAVLTQETAKRYFGDKDPINKVIKTQNAEFIVTGVCENVPPNSHLDFDILAGVAGNQFLQNLNFIGFSAYTYVVLKDKSSPEKLEAKFPEMVLKYAAPQIEQNTEISYQAYQEAGNGYRYFLQNIQDIHLKSQLEAEMKVNGSMSMVYILISIALFILMIACINFMNLTTARSSERAKEVGVRKSLGSFKKQLIFQFLTESVLVSLISLLIAFVIISMVLPAFNSLVQKELVLDLNNWDYILFSIVFSSFIGLIAGSYPAFVISSFSPVTILKGKIINSVKGAWLRNGLVIFQFSISIILIAGTLVINDQLEYLFDKDLGFQKDNMIVVERAFALQDKLETFKDQVRNIAEVENIGSTTLMPGNDQFFGSLFTPEGKTEAFTTKTMVIDEDFEETLGFQIVEGRDFSKAYNDSATILLNEKAVQVLGIENPVGSRLSVRQVNVDVNPTYTIVGIVKDFHFQSLKDNISPLAILSTDNPNHPQTGFLVVRAGNADLSKIINHVETLWTKFLPEEPFTYSIFEEDLMRQYKPENTTSKVFAIFSALAILIGCVGLFGLAAYTASKRTKEIGVRKVLGASVFSVVFMLSKEFTKLILWAMAIATPVAYFLMDWWLQEFPYKIKLGIGVFVISGITALIVAWLTVSYQSIKAAINNPVKSLKVE
ncbi:ABC transporter permease [Flexithrix dorotheae]|uniref:ABC transporter permease n=1 Tax=Flexithrix dorotheae TaxID=70993 RepID=UPI00035C439D|nr:ABC transporter permease [Flexithrix dorotheae]